MECRPDSGRHSVVRASEPARPRQFQVAPGESGTNATAGFVYNSLGPRGTFTNRVQGGFGQAVQRRG